MFIITHKVNKDTNDSVSNEIQLDLSQYNFSGNAFNANINITIANYWS